MSAWEKAFRLPYPAWLPEWLLRYLGKRWCRAVFPRETGPWYCWTFALDGEVWTVVERD